MPASIIRRALLRRALYILMAPLGESTERNQKTALMSNGGENMVLADHGTVLPPGHDGGTCAQSGRCISWLPARSSPGRGQRGPISVCDRFQLFAQSLT